MYEFTEDCMIHIEQIDNEHRKLFQMLNEAFTMVQETEDASAITISLLSNLKNYAMTHFAHEEAYMENSACHVYPEGKFFRSGYFFSGSCQKIPERPVDLFSPLAVPAHFMQRYDDWEIPFEFRERSFCLHIQIHDWHYTH